MTGREKSLAYQTEQRRYNFLRIWQKRYAHMKARAEGKSTNKSYSSGKGLMSQEKFIEWCKEYDNLVTFITLYMEWAEQDFSLPYAPSIDRIDPSRGYLPNNIQWMSFTDNCIKNNKDPITHKRLHLA